MFWRRDKAGRKVVGVAGGAFAILVLVPLVYFWFTAPPDPIYEGERLSAILYGVFHQPGAATPEIAGARMAAASEKCRAALKHLGAEASPLVSDWLQDEPSLLRQKIRTLLYKQRINFPFFTANRASIIESIMWYPEAAVAVAPHLQQRIVEAESRTSLDYALKYAGIFNSIDEPSRRTIASRSGPFVDGLLDRFERDGEDIYALALIGMILKADREFLSAEEKARILKLERKSNYLRGAAALLR